MREKVVATIFEAVAQSIEEMKGRIAFLEWDARQKEKEILALKDIALKKEEQN